MYPDNRNQRRVHCKARLVGATSTVLYGDLIDISATGLCIVGDTALERGRELHLEFELAGGKVEAVAEVRWAIVKNGRHELGLRFVRISAESLSVIAAATAPKPPIGGGFWFSQFAMRR